MRSCALITTTRVTCQRRNWLESNHSVAMAAQPSPHISFNTNKYNILRELAHHTKWRLCKAKILEAFCCFRSVASVWKVSEFKPIIPPDSNTQRRLHYFASHDMQWTRPSFWGFFCTFGYKKLWQSCLRMFRPILQHAAVPDSPSAKPSANLLPNSFCFPTITPPAPRIPGTGPLSGAALNKETQMLRHTGRLAGHFYCISQYKDINRGRRQETKVCGKRCSLPAPTVVQPSSVNGKEKSKPYCKSWLTSDNHLFSIGTN